MGNNVKTFNAAVTDFTLLIEENGSCPDNFTIQISAICPEVRCICNRTSFILKLKLSSIDVSDSADDWVVENINKEDPIKILVTLLQDVFSAVDVKDVSDKPFRIQVDETGNIVAIGNFLRSEWLDISEIATWVDWKCFA